MTQTHPAQTAPPPMGSGGRNIGGEVRALVTNVVNLANHLGDTASAQELTSRATAADTTARIVVVGEAKQGKSSLINALVGAVNLSPVDADIATAVPLHIAYGPEPSATLTLTSGNTLTVAPSELAGWVSMVGAPLGQLRQVASVDVAVPSQLLEPGVVLVDTPGVGGLVAGHAKMTLRSLESATAMLFVTDADTKLTQPELDFLALATDRIAAVVFVITKIDATPDWRSVMAEDREVLARYAPRYANAPMVAVSARLATRSRAASETDRPLAANLWAESGMGPLQSWVSQRIRPVATTLAVANTVAYSRSILDRLRATAERNLATATANPAVTAAFEAEQERVNKLRNDQMMWGTSLERKLYDARTTVRNQVRDSSESVKEQAMLLVKTSKNKGTDLIVAQVDADLDAQAQELSELLNKTAADVCARTLEELDIASPLELTRVGIWRTARQAVRPEQHPGHVAAVGWHGGRHRLGHRVAHGQPGDHGWQPGHQGRRRRRRHLRRGTGVRASGARRPSRWVCHHPHPRRAGASSRARHVGPLRGRPRGQ